MQVGARSYIDARSPWDVFRWSLVGLIFASQLAWLAYARGQRIEAKNPYANDPAALRKGGTTYRVNCDFCHGISARGENGAPDLTSPRTQKRSDAELFRIILGGRPGTEMPQMISLKRKRGRSSLISAA